jgi:hypothetical protein
MPHKSFGSPSCISFHLDGDFNFSQSCVYWKSLHMHAQFCFLDKKVEEIRIPQHFNVVI